ncbi:MAG: hypothetical protein HPY61_10265 [Methanotrichaceae archaeon]|nr:hypothetical protein [Methanotrichaceae archaeon]
MENAAIKTTRFANLVMSHEDWLVQRVLSYAKENGYTRYTSTLADAWKTSMSDLSQSLLECLKEQLVVPELLADEDYKIDLIAKFSIFEAKRHRKRSVSLGMFLGLMKYYRQSYIDLVMRAAFEIEEGRSYTDCLSIGSLIESNSDSVWSETA